MSFFVIAPPLSTGKDTIRQANIMAAQKMMNYLSQFPDVILMKVACHLSVEINPYIISQFTSKWKNQHSMSI